jgi:hypothetical protein
MNEHVWYHEKALPVLIKRLPLLSYQCHSMTNLQQNISTYRYQI